MSTYAMMTGGPHPLAGLWLTLLNANPVEIPRLRDAYIIVKDDKPLIYILTRQASDYLRELAGYVDHRRAMPGDTYYEYEFEVPEPWADNVLKAGRIVRRPPFAENFQKIMAKLEGGKDTEDEPPYTAEERKQAEEALNPIVESLP